MRDLVAGVGTLILIAGALGIYMGFGTEALGLAAIGACIVVAALASRRP